MLCGQIGAIQAKRFPVFDACNQTTSSKRLFSQRLIMCLFVPSAPPLTALVLSGQHVSSDHVVRFYLVTRSQDSLIVLPSLAGCQVVRSPEENFRRPRTALDAAKTLSEMHSAT